MNEHFCTVGETLQSQLPQCDRNLFKEYLPDSIINSFVISHVIREDIICEIKKNSTPKIHLVQMVLDPKL